MTANRRITIIGGGIIGLVTGLFLARGTATLDTDYRIEIIEKDKRVGNQSSSVAGYGIRTVYRHPVNLYLAQKGLQFWSTLSRTSDIGFRRNGYLFLTDSRETGRVLRREQNRQISNGFSAELRQPTKPAEFTTGAAGTYRTGLFSPVSAVSDSTKSLDVIKALCEENDIRDTYG